MKSTNPALKRLNGQANGVEYVDGELLNAGATYAGVSAKALIYVGITVIFAVIAAMLTYRYPAVALVGMIISIVVAFIMSIVCTFSRRGLAVTGSIYAAFEGFAVGALSGLLHFYVEGLGGVVFAALLSTFVTFGVVMLLHATGLVRPGRRARAFVFCALISVGIMGLFMLVMFLIPGTNAVFFYSIYPYIMLAVTVIMIIVAIIYLFMDLQAIDNMVQSGMPKHTEWNAAFSLTVTLIWLYIELLRLFVLIASIVGRKR